MDIGITDREFSLLSDLISNEAGINLPEHKKPMLVSRLRKRLHTLKIESFSDYYSMVSMNRTELLSLLDSISTNITEFFREQAHFDFLQGGFLEKLVAKAKYRNERRIRIWSVACSTGEEPYSIAITLLEGLTLMGCLNLGWDIKILASDINTSVLKVAESGKYTGDSLRKVSQHLWSKYFLKGIGRHSGEFRVKDFVKEMVLFRRINLKENVWPVREGFDAVFCRNVLIYFDKQTQEQTVAKLVRYVNDGAYLFLGHSESLAGMSSGLKMAAPSIYQKM